MLLKPIKGFLCAKAKILPSGDVCSSQIRSSASLRGKTVEEPSFHQFHRKTVGQNHGGQDKEKEDGSRHETEVNTGRGERQKTG